MAAMIEKEALGILNLMPSNPFLYTRIVGHNLWYKVWSGRYSEAESGMKRALVLAEKEEQIDSFPGLYRDLGFVLGLQRRWRQSQEYFLESSKKYQERGESNTGLGSTHGFWGAILVQQGKFQEAKEYLTNSLSIKKEIQDNNGIPEILVWLGQMSEMEAKEVQGKNQNDFLSQAESYYIQCLSYRWTGRHHCECAALTGLVRVKHAQGETTTILPLLAEAEQLAQQYEYNDHLVSLRLTQVHLAWENQNKADILFFYRQAMVHALRFNRFLLDELLSGRPQETSLRPIIPYCLEHGEEGKEILVALRDWWKTGVNDIGTPRSDTISPIPEGISLLEAEKIVRGREPGDGTIQKSVVEQIEMVMK
jgi:tetratricopeptide (TPR) repeat protein